MKYKDIKSLSLEERGKILLEEEEKLRGLVFAHAISPIENPMRIRQTRKLVARIKTAQNAQASKNN